MSITLWPTAGAHRSSALNVAADGLTYSFTDQFGYRYASASALSSATKFQFEHTLNAFGNLVNVGLYDGTQNFNTTSLVPGWDTSEGFECEIAASGGNVRVNKTVVGSLGASAVGDVLTIVVDTTAATNNIRLYRTRSGTTTLILTTTYLPTSGEFWPFAGGRGAPTTFAGGGTVNFAGPFARALDSGYSAYDAAAPATVTGTASGTIALTGSASATVPVSAAATGSLTLTGLGATKVAVTATASKSIAFTGSASAVVALSASATGSFALTGAAVGTVPVFATAAGTLGLSGSATGALGTTVTATASGSLGLTGSANATVAVSAAATGTFGLSGSGTASVDILASVSGSLALTGASVATIADNIATGTASGTLDFGGTADVAVLIRASANDNLALTGSARAGGAPPPTPARRTSHSAARMGASSSPPVQRTTYSPKRAA